MRLSTVIPCFIIIFFNNAIARDRGIFSALLNTKPVYVKADKPMQPEAEIGDECPRQYPLIPRIRQQVRYAFKRYGVVPDLLTNPPAHLLEVKYEHNKSCQPYLGNNIDVCDVLAPPSELKWNYKDDKLYTIFVIDINPLGTTRPTLLANGILWWIVDIPACNIDDGKTIFEYQAPIPFYGAGESRYVVLVYEQPDYEIDWSEEPIVRAVSLKHRFNRCLDKLVKKYQLNLIAGNFFVSQFDPCLEPIFIGMDIPYPQYFDKAIEAADLPADPNAIVVR